MREIVGRFVVSDDRLVRCEWCGTTQSENWIFSRVSYGIKRYFCSRDCQRAYGAEELKWQSRLSGAFAGIIAFSSLLFFASIRLNLSSGLAIQALQIGSVFTFAALFLAGVSVHLHRQSQNALQIRESIPTGSRRESKWSEVSSFETVSITVKCSECGNIFTIEDLKYGMAYECSFCAAKGVVE